MAEFIQPPAHAADSKRVLWVKLNRLLEGGGPIPPDYDPDAVAFAAATGATDVAGLSALFSGWKALALWDVSLLFPMRAGQNYGTGSALKIAGGLAAGREATLVNGPAWSAGGIVFDGSNDLITTTVGDFTTAQSIGAVVNQPGTGGSNQIVVQSRTGSAGGVALRINNPTTTPVADAWIYTAGSDLSVQTSFSVSTTVLLSATYSANGTAPSDATIRMNKGARATNSNLNSKATGTDYHIGSAANNGSPFTGTISLVYIYQGKLSEATQEAIYDLLVECDYLP